MAEITSVHPGFGECGAARRLPGGGGRGLTGPAGRAAPIPSSPRSDTHRSAPEPPRPAGERERERAGGPAA